jgi:hypothetical protein
MKKTVSLFILSLMCSTTFGKAINFDELLQQDIPTIKGRLKEKVEQYGNSKKLYKELAGLYTTKAAFLDIFSRLEQEQIPYLEESILRNYIPAINEIHELKASPVVLLQRSEKEEEVKESESSRIKERIRIIKKVKDGTKDSILPNLLKAGREVISSKSEKVAKKAEEYKKAYAAMTLQCDHLEALSKLSDEELVEGIKLRLGYLKKYNAAKKIAKIKGPIFFNKKGQYVKKSLVKDDPIPVFGATSPSIPFGASPPGPAFGISVNPTPTPLFGASSAISSPFGTSPAVQGPNGFAALALPAGSNCGSRYIARGIARGRRQSKYGK